MKNPKIKMEINSKVKKEVEITKNLENIGFMKNNMKQEWINKSIMDFVDARKKTTGKEKPCKC